ncbi:hypothetical protein GH714_030600 [Hevea brasiliensis]|uniref:APO domain-containing protein n=1 Tax=Hevea brasiliensis TaxID=3981 RepID=A0A6A6NBS7_HEVBR|nr:hypothetical protein GH714_030600 [Hevea brasiliensis]
MIEDLVGPNYVWHVRDFNGPPLDNKLKRYYGKAPAVVELCVQTGAPIPDQYQRTGGNVDAYSIIRGLRFAVEEAQPKTAQPSSPSPWFACTVAVRVFPLQLCHTRELHQVNRLKISPQDVEENICKLTEKGLTPQIGVILCDSYGISKVKSVTGSKICAS